jgi:hypothetical protein
MDELGEAPRDDVERALADIWRHVLGVDTVGVFDDFYDIGGHSLLAMSLASQVTSRLHIDFPVNEVERRPTIASQAEAITRALSGDGASAAPTAQTHSPDARSPTDPGTG